MFFHFSLIVTLLVISAETAEQKCNVTINLILDASNPDDLRYDIYWFAYITILELAPSINVKWTIFDRDSNGTLKEFTASNDLASTIKSLGEWKNNLQTTGDLSNIVDESTFTILVNSENGTVKARRLTKDTNTVIAKEELKEELLDHCKTLGIKQESSTAEQNLNENNKDNQIKYPFSTQSALKDISEENPDCNVDVLFLLDRDIPANSIFEVYWLAYATLYRLYNTPTLQGITAVAEISRNGTKVLHGFEDSQGEEDLAAAIAGYYKNTAEESYLGESSNEQVILRISWHLNLDVYILKRPKNLTEVLEYGGGIWADVAREGNPSSPEELIGAVESLCGRQPL